MSIDLKPPFQGLTTRITAQMMTAQTAATDGEWVDFGHISIWSIHVKDISGGDVAQIRVSNTLIKPDVTDNGVQLGRDIKAERSVSSAEHRFRWVKVKKTIGGASATNAFLFGDWRLHNR